MAGLVKNKIGGKAYYYARECKRVDSRPKIVWQKYLGKARGDIVRCMTEAGAAALAQPREALIAEFGAVAALYDLAERLQIAAKVVRHAKYVTFQMAEVAVPRELSAAILDHVQRSAIAVAATRLSVTIGQRT